MSRLTEKVVREHLFFWSEALIYTWHAFHYTDIYVCKAVFGISLCLMLLQIRWLIRYWKNRYEGIWLIQEQLVCSAFPYFLSYIKLWILTLNKIIVSNVKAMMSLKWFLQRWWPGLVALEVWLQKNGCSSFYCYCYSLFFIV